MYIIDCLNNAPMSKNDVVNIMTMCKDYLKQSHEAIHVNLPKINNEVREIVDVLNRIECQSNNNSDNKVIINLNRTFNDIYSENSNQHISDENEVANILLNINDIGSNAEKYPNPNDKKEDTPSEFYKIVLDHNVSDRRKFIEYSVKNNLIPIKISTAYAFLNRSIEDVPIK